MLIRHSFVDLPRVNVDRVVPKVGERELVLVEVQHVLVVRPPIPNFE